MDHKTKSGLDINRSPGFIVQDLADEEVHFSRGQPDEFYHIDHHNQVFNSSNQYKYQLHRHNPSKIELETKSFSDINLYQNIPNNNGGNGYPSYNFGENYHAHSDQIKSSRLLNSIGSRIRRGSSYYLIAPKLVGQYLLGITIQNWSEFLNTSRMLKAPGNRHQLTRRLLTNLNYFQGNYLCVSLILIIYCILTSPLLLLAIASYLLVLYLVTARSALGKQLKFIGYRLNLQQQYSFITMIYLPLLWVAGAPSAMFWVIGASFFVVGVHASMYANDQVTPPAMTQADQLHINNPVHLGHLDNIHNRSSVQYYNHHPNQTAYVSLPEPSSPTTLSPAHIKESASTAAAGYRSFAHWISFGATSINDKVLNDKKDNRKANVSTQGIRVPEVKIISQDYAGLGRVYEV